MPAQRQQEAWAIATLAAVFGWGRSSLRVEIVPKRTGRLTQSGIQPPARRQPLAVHGAAAKRRAGNE